MNKIYYFDKDQIKGKDVIKHYALIISQKGQIISSTEDMSRGKVFNNETFRLAVGYYDKQREDKKKDWVLSQE